MRGVRVILCAALVAAFLCPVAVAQIYPVCCYDPVHSGFAYMSDNITGCGGHYMGTLNPDGTCYNQPICCADTTGPIGAWTESTMVIGCGQGTAYTPSKYLPGFHAECPALTTYYCANWLPFYGGPGPGGFCTTIIDWSVSLTGHYRTQCYTLGGSVYGLGSCVEDACYNLGSTPRPPGWRPGPRTCAYNWPGQGDVNPDCISVPCACPPGYNDASCIPAPTPTPTPTPTPPSGSCTSPSGTCWPVPGIFGTTCASPPNTFSVAPCPPPPTPTPTPRQGEITWRPQHTNYSQSPFVTQDGDTTHLGFHVGFCCGAYKPNDWANWERPILVTYSSNTVRVRDPLLYPPSDTHEFGMGSMVWLEAQKSWLVAGARTTWSSWLAWQKSGFTLQNRARGWFALFKDLDSDPYRVWWDANVPWDDNCRERNTCDNSTGPHMPTVLWIDAINGFLVPRQLWLFVRDDTDSMKGTSEMAAYTVTFEDDEIVLHKEFIPVFHAANGSALTSVMLLDIALGAGDGTLYGLVSAQYDDAGHATCWYLSCTAIDEWVSGDGGRNWNKGWHSWQAPKKQAPGGLPPLPVYVADGGYLRDKWGRIDQSYRSLISMVADNQDPTSNTWFLYYWLDPRVPVARAWGLDPGTAIPRRHLEMNK